MVVADTNNHLFWRYPGMMELLFERLFHWSIDLIQNKLSEVQYLFSTTWIIKLSFHSTFNFFSFYHVMVHIHQNCLLIGQLLVNSHPLVLWVLNPANGWHQNGLLVYHKLLKKKLVELLKRCQKLTWNWLVLFYAYSCFSFNKSKFKLIGLIVFFYFLSFLRYDII